MGLSAREMEVLAGVAGAMRVAARGLLVDEPGSRVGRGLLGWAARLDIAAGVSAVEVWERVLSRVA